MNKPDVARSNETANSALKSGALELAIHEFLAFKLGDEEYGMDILRAQEIRSLERHTRMANAPACILGVINLRGVIVPIIDMLTPEQLRPSPEFSSTIGSDHLLAIGSLENRMLILLDIEKLMTSAEMGLVTQAVQ